MNGARARAGRRVPSDPTMLSPSDGEAFSRAREAARLAGRPMPSLDEFLRGTDPARGRDVRASATPTPPVAARVCAHPDDDASAPIAPGIVTLRRIGAGVAGVLLTAPRTKKNSTELGIRQSESYRKYKAALLQPLRDAVAAVGPLPTDVRYNVCAHFYPDTPGSRGDANNFYAAFADLLENVGLIANDHEFRRWWGSDVFEDHASTPRTEFVILPIELVTVTIPPSYDRVLSRGCSAA